MQNNNMFSVGIDIGTTSISAVVVNVCSGEIVDSVTYTHNAAIDSELPWDKRQRADVLIISAREILDGLLDSHSNICSIGVTGQMHGILYLDKNNKPCSDLYTWEDQRAGLEGENGSLCKQVFDLTGLKISAGYGIATHLYLLNRKDISPDAVTFCTIMDAFVSDICGCCPKCHSTNAASFGLYSIEDSMFDNAALEIMGLNRQRVSIPATSDTLCKMGEYRHIPVMIPIGDNQASYFGSVGFNREAILVNVGTGSQVALIADRDEIKNIDTTPDLEIRPYFNDSFLVCGSALCGGRAYAITETFFRSIAEKLGVDADNQFSLLNEFANDGIENSSNISPLTIRTTFSGKRSNPELFGKIENIREENFTPEMLVSGILYGMANELYELYVQTRLSNKHKLVLSGNGIRKNPALCKVMRDTFDLQPEIPVYQEEASRGAAILSAYAMSNIEIAKEMYKYKAID